MPELFSPITLGSLRLEHRVAMAPLTRCRAIEGDVPSPMAAEYYAQRARAHRGVAGACPIISEATQISLQGRGYPHTPGIHSREQIAGWRRVTDAVHAQGGAIFCQLWHVGRISHPDFQPGGAAPVAPSPVTPPGLKRVYANVRKPYVTPRPLEIREITQPGGIIDSFRTAALNALDAGFDGVEIHGANGYLIDQFLRDGTNLRTDDWGGSVHNRARLALEIAGACAQAIGPARVGIRLSPSGGAGDRHDSDPRSTFSYLVEKLAPLNLPYVHLLRSLEGDAEGGAPIVDLAVFRPLFPGVLMFNGRYTPEEAQQAVRNGECDMIAFGRLFIANPDLPARIRHALPLATPDESTFYGAPGVDPARGYTDYLPAPPASRP